MAATRDSEAQIAPTAVSDVPMMFVQTPLVYVDVVDIICNKQQ